MPVPKRKRSRARRDSRFANKGLKAKPFSACSNCKDPILGHQICASCGYYKGKKVMTTKIERAVKRGEARKAQMAQRARAQEHEEAPKE
jgi:large subunit ribosomal protein L32